MDNNISKNKSDFLTILKECKQVNSCNAYLLQNDNPKKCKILPNSISNNVLIKYINSFEWAIADREFVEYVPDTKDSQQRQVINCRELHLWDGMKNVVDALPLDNIEDIEIADYNKEGNTIVYKIATNEPTYFLTYHKKVEQWFTNGYKFMKDEQTKEFRQERGDILALQSICGVLIREDKCFILYEDIFNKVFKHDERITQEVEQNKEKILAIDFIADVDMFYENVIKTKQQRSNMAKIIGGKRLEEIKTLTPNQIKTSLMARDELKDILEFDENDRIKIDKKSYAIIIDVLRGKISIDILTQKTLGVDNE